MSNVTTVGFAALLGSMALAATGCGDDGAGTGGSGGQGGAGTGTTTGTTSTTGTTTSTAGDGGGGSGQGGAGTGGSGSGGADACAGDPRTPITFVVRNDTSERIWFQGSGFGPTLLANITVDGNAFASCPCDELSACSGMQASVSYDVGYLEPGGSFEETWVGLIYAPVEANPVCAEQLSCSVGSRPADGDHTGSVTAYRGEPECNGACDCDLAEANVCNFGDGAMMASDPFDATATFSFPGDTTVQIAFTD